MRNGCCMLIVLCLCPWRTRYSSAGVVVGDVAWLVGGVSLNQSAEIIAVNVPARSWSEYKIQVSLYAGT